MSWGTTVGDDRDTLLEAFRLAGDRSDAVIVNGGLGPTVDDLSQEIAAKAAGVNLVLNEHWLERIEALFRRHNVVMQPNNRKQALLPATAEIIDNPIGTACGFELNIGRARFYFTPGVPQELHLDARCRSHPTIARAQRHGHNFASEAVPFVRTR